MIYCIECGYCLEGLSEHRCPECGETFDPNDPDSYAIDDPHGRPYRSGVTFLIASVVGATSLFAPLYARGIRTVGQEVFCFAIAVLLGVLFAGVAALSFRRHRYGACLKAGLWIAGISLAFLAGLFLLAQVRLVALPRCWRG